jgi:hypothetical protein
MKIIAITMSLMALVVPGCFADEGRRFYSEGTYELQKGDGSTWTLHVGKCSKVLAPLQNPVIQTQRAFPCDETIIIIVEGANRWGYSEF